MQVGIRCLNQFEKGSQDSLFLAIADIMCSLRKEDDSSFTREINGKGAEYDLLRTAYELIINDESPSYISTVLDFEITKIMKNTPQLCDESLLRIVIVKHMCKVLLSRSWNDFFDIAYYICNAETYHEIGSYS